MNAVLGVVTLGAARLDRPKDAGDQAGKRANKERNEKSGAPNDTAPDADDLDKGRNEHRHRIHEKIYWVASVVVSLLTLATAVAAAIFARLAYEAANSQAETARIAFIESDRPIFEVSFLEEDTLGTSNSSRPKITLSAQNIGAKPGYVRTINVSVEVKPDKIGNCDSQQVARLVNSGSGLKIPCNVNTLTVPQLNRIEHFSSIVYTVEGKIFYRSLTGSCWVKVFKFFRADKNEFLPAHMVPAGSDDANAEYPADCRSNTISKG